MMAAGLLFLDVMPAHPSTLDVVWRMTICGFGFGFFNSPNNRAMIAAAPRSRTGGASGMLSTARLLGQTTGAALVALAFGLFPVNGTGLTLLMGACFSAGAAGVSCLRLMNTGRAAAAE
jgi:DHA2 family multidrug resistance protein-like MFS transporter